jgi:hypothetical protein
MKRKPSEYLWSVSMLLSMLAAPYQSIGLLIAAVVAVACAVLVGNLEHRKEMAEMSERLSRF